MAETTFKTKGGAKLQSSINSINKSKGLNLEGVKKLINKSIKDSKEVDETTGASSSGSYQAPLLISKNGKPNPKVTGSLIKRGFEVASIVAEQEEYLKILDNSFCEQILKEDRKNNSQLIGDKVKTMNKKDFEKSLYDNQVIGDDEKPTVLTKLFPKEFQETFEKNLKDKKKATDAIENDEERSIRIRGLEDTNIPLEDKLKYVPKDDKFKERIKQKDNYQKTHQVQGPLYWMGTALNEDMDLSDIPTLFAYKIDKFGTRDLMKFKTNEVKFVNKIEESFSKLSHIGMNDEMYNQFNFYVNEENELFVTEVSKFLKENESLNKMNYLANYKKKKG